MDILVQLTSERARLSVDCLLKLQYLYCTQYCVLVHIQDWKPTIDSPTNTGMMYGPSMHVVRILYSSQSRLRSHHFLLKTQKLLHHHLLTTCPATRVG